MKTQIIIVSKRKDKNQGGVFVKYFIHYHSATSETKEAYFGTDAELQYWLSEFEII